jgi:UDP-galactose transporter B1
MKSFQEIYRLWWIKFIIGTAGIYTFMVCYALLQEKLYTKDYTNDPSIKFDYSFAIILLQQLFSYILAFTINRKYYKVNKSTMNLNTEMIIGFCKFGGMLTANASLLHVSYPVQALMKSSKIISILLVSLCFATGEKYAKSQYLTGFKITTGIVTFNLWGNMDSGEKQSNIIGILLLMLSVFLDGLLGVKQTEAKRKFQPTAFDQMESLSKWCVIFTLGYSIVFFQLAPFLYFCYDYPSVLKDIVLLAITGTFGQVFTFYMIFHFSPLVMSIVATTRKFFSVVVSILVYEHDINLVQWGAIALVFAGVALELMSEGNKKQKEALTPEHLTLVKAHVKVEDIEAEGRQKK